MFQAMQNHFMVSKTHILHNTRIYRTALDKRI